MEEQNAVKELLFDYIKRSEGKFKNLIKENEYSKIINDIVDNCYDSVLAQGDREENLGVLATGILHYLLTNALISSQRKVEINGIEIDIVIPDQKTLQKDPKMAVIIYIPKTIDKSIIKKRLQQLQNIQPEKNNIWLVLSKKMSLENKTYVISKEDSNFSKIIFDIAQFTNVHGNNKFKILRI